MRDLNVIADDLGTQNGRMTEHPVFVVEQRKRDYGFESGYSDDYVWMECETGDYETLDPDDDLGEEDRAAVEKFEKAEDECDPTSPWEKVYYKDRWEFVTACFTEKGAENFIAIQRHNLNETRIYVHSAFRNFEWQAIRSGLLRRGVHPDPAP